MTTLILQLVLAALLAAQSQAGTVPPETSHVLVGLATHYPACDNCGAASRQLKRFIGRGWKGDWVTVTNVANGKSVRVKLVTGCACGHRQYQGERRPTVIDLSVSAFTAIASYGTGVIEVRVEAGASIDLPATDTIEETP